MKIKDILKIKGAKVWMVKENENCRNVVDLLVSQKIGAAIVCDEKANIVGVISERDIMRVCQEKGNSWETVKVKGVMTERVIIGNPEDELEYVMGVMTKNKIRHMPIMSDSKLEGVVSIGDVVKAQLHEVEYEVKYLKEYLAGGG